MKYYATYFLKTDCLFKNLRLESLSKKPIVMSIQSRIVNTVATWCGKRPDSLSNVLKDLWDDTAPGSSHSSLDFDPDGIDDLIQKLHSEFASPPKRQVNATGPDFRGGSRIRTVQNLVDEALAFPLVESMGFVEAALPPRKPARVSTRRKKAAKPKGAKIAKKQTAKRPAARKRRA